LPAGVVTSKHRFSRDRSPPGTLLELMDDILRSYVPSPAEQTLLGRAKKPVMEPLADGDGRPIIPVPERCHIVEAGESWRLEVDWRGADRPGRKLDQLDQSRMRNLHCRTRIRIRKEPAAELDCS